LPTVYLSRNFIIDGGLISYGPDQNDLYRRSDGCVDPKQRSRVALRALVQRLGISVDHFEVKS
jgi:hypothetical protein